MPFPCAATKLAALAMDFDSMVERIETLIRTQETF